MPSYVCLYDRVASAFVATFSLSLIGMSLHDGREHRGASGAWNPHDRWPGLYGVSDTGLARGLQCLFGNSSVLDVGAGAGQYGAYFHSCKSGQPSRWDGVPRWRGIDGNPSVENFTSAANGAPQGAAVRHVDFCHLRLALPLPRRDWVMSLEVGEHLPTECIPGFLALINKSAIVGAVISWGATAQGRGHINPRTKEQVKELLLPFGLVQNEELGVPLRSHAVLPWLKAGVHVYVRASASLQMRFAADGSRVRQALNPYKCRSLGDRCWGGKSCGLAWANKPWYIADNCYTMAHRCPCSFAVVPRADLHDEDLAIRLSRSLGPPTPADFCFGGLAGVSESQRKACKRHLAAIRNATSP